MRSFRALTIAAVLAGCTASSSPSGTGFPEAFATRQCGPADGAIVAIYLTPSPQPPEAPDGQPVPPFLRLTILHDIGQIAGRTFTWNAPGQVEAGADRCETAGPCTSASSGVIRIGAVDENRRTTGSYDLRLGGARLQGSFTAPWRERLILCG